MKTTKLLVIGGVAAGASFAARARRLCESAGGGWSNSGFLARTEAPVPYGIGASAFFVPVSARQ